MGFMDNFRQSQPQTDLLAQARQMVGDDPHAALANMQANGAVVNLPNGKTLPVSEVVKMAEGKTAMQFLAELMR